MWKSLGPRSLRHTTSWRRLPKATKARAVLTHNAVLLSRSQRGLLHSGPIEVTEFEQGVGVVSPAVVQQPRQRRSWPTVDRASAPF
jgi:hypothetical protein